MITSKLKFDCFPGLHGKFESNNIELTVTGPQPVLQKLTKYLTVTDKGVLWQVNHLKKAVKRHECLIAKCDAEGFQDVREEARYNKAKQKVVELKAQIAELVPNIKKEYYGVNDNGSVNIPSGFYYLCETIENNHHLNTEIPTYIVPGCRDYQEEMIRAMMKRKRATGVLATGCHVKGQKILMFDGSLKNVEDIIVGDKIMGPDSTARTVLNLHRGHQDMAKIIPVKGEPFIVNMDHMLSLRMTNKKSIYRKEAGLHRTKNFKGLNRVVNLSVRDYLTKSKTFKHCHKLYRASAVDFVDTGREYTIDPYILGLWLGDGHSNEAALTTMDNEIKDIWVKWVEDCGLNVAIRKKTNSNNKASTYAAVSKKKHYTNKCNCLLRDLNVINNKHIPYTYLTGSRYTRLETLAGLIDSDGSLHKQDRATIEYVSKLEALAGDVVFLARSLGFAAYIKKTIKSCQTGARGEYYRICIFGDTYQIPCRLPRKRAIRRTQLKNPLVTGFTVEQLPPDDYYGFSVDGDHLYLMGDFTVTHNCGKTRVIASLALSAVQANKKAMVIVPTAYLVGQMFFYLKTLYNKVHAIGGTFGQRPVGDAKILITTMDSAIKHVDSFEMIAVDESHHTSATTWFETLCNARSATHVYNVTATPFRQDGLDLAIHAFGGPTVYERDVRWGIEHNWLARPKITQILLQCYRIPFMPNSNLKMFDSIIPEMKAYSSIIRSPEVLSFLRAKVKMCLDKGRRVIVIFKTVKAGEVFRQYCKGHIDFSVASAQTKKSRYPLDAFRRGETNLLVSNVKLISEGLDIPDASILFNVVQNSGDVATLQMSGRVLRISPNKPEPVIFDIQLSSYEKFERAAASRREIYEKMTGQAVEYFVR